MGVFSFGLLFFLLGLAVIPLLLVGFSLGRGPGLLCGGLSVAYLIALGVVQSTLQAIFRAALYAYAETGTVPEAFGESALKDAMAARA